MSAIDLYPGFDKDCPAIIDPIEPGIQPVCDALNSIQCVHTLWSCEGHPERPSRPYVTFIGPQETAFKIHQLLGPENGDKGLKYCWWLVAGFRDDGSMQYTIEPNDYRILEPHRLPFIRRWRKTDMELELLRLAQLLRRLEL